MSRFKKDTLKQFLPTTFKGLSKKYIIDAVFDKKIQATWKLQVGDIIVGSTGNVFVISAYHQGHKKVGGDKYFFGGGLCNRNGSCLLNETFSFVMNEDGLEYFYGENGIETRENSWYSKFTDFRFVPYPHENKKYCTRT